MEADNVRDAPSILLVSVKNNVCNSPFLLCLVIKAKLHQASL